MKHPRRATAPEDRNDENPGLLLRWETAARSSRACPVASAVPPSGEQNKEHFSVAPYETWREKGQGQR